MRGDRALLLIRLKPLQPDGTVVGERRRVCHLVPVPDSQAMPELLVAFCGLRIAPGTGEMLASAVGMPCELCMAHSPVPAFAMLRSLRHGVGGGNADC